MKKTIVQLNVLEDSIEIKSSSNDNSSLFLNPQTQKQFILWKQMLRNLLPPSTNASAFYQQQAQSQEHMQQQQQQQQQVQEGLFQESSSSNSYSNTSINPNLYSLMYQLSSKDSQYMMNLDSLTKFYSHEYNLFQEKCKLLPQLLLPPQQLPIVVVADQKSATPKKPPSQIDPLKQLALFNNFFNENLMLNRFFSRKTISENFINLGDELSLKFHFITCENYPNHPYFVRYLKGGKVLPCGNSMIHVALQIGPWLLQFQDDSLVHIEKAPSVLHSTRIDLEGYLNIANEPVVQQLIKKIVHYNCSVVFAGSLVADNNTTSNTTPNTPKTPTPEAAASSSVVSSEATSNSGNNSQPESPAASNDESSATTAATPTPATPIVTSAATPKNIKYAHSAAIFSKAK